MNESIPQLHLDSPVWLPEGKFAFRITGKAPHGVVIQSSTNYSTWTPLSTNALSGGQFWYTNSGQAGFQKKLFRATTPP